MTYEKLDSLGQLLGCYFHQDWSQEFENDQDAIDAILAAEPKENVESSVGELDVLLARPLDEEELRAILIGEVGCYFDPASLGISYRQWLSRVRDELAKK